MLGWYTIASEEALMSVTDAEAISDVADRLFEAIEQSDIAMVEQLWNPDVIVWKVADRDRDRERAMRVIAWFVNTTTDRRYEILDRQVFEGGFVQQHILHANGRRRIDRDAGLHRDQVGRQRSDQSHRRVLRPGRDSTAAGVGRFTTDVTWQVHRNF